MKRTSALLVVVALGLLSVAPRRGASSEPQEGILVSSVVNSLDSNDWRLATDPRNEGRSQQWWSAPRADARVVRVPSIIQGTFPGYHGVAWYWRDFSVPPNPHARGQFILRFGTVDYLAEVWLNGVPVGSHEGGETPFEIDVTRAVRTGPAARNRLAVRVVNPSNEPIEGVTLAETARRCKVVPFSAGAAFNHGGITGPVELLETPELRISDTAVVATLEQGHPAGRVSVDIEVMNSSQQARAGVIDLTIAPAAAGTTLAVGRVLRSFPPGQSRHKVEIAIPSPKLWGVNDPNLYRASAVVRGGGSASVDERSARFGFRDFRFADGAFRLNGRRFYLRSTHTCNHFPIGLQFPQDPDFVRRDLLNLKAMGFNAVRFIWGGATPEQLDYCDEIGLLVYEESYASAPIADSPRMVGRFDSNVSELIRRDRNHPSVVIWGLLNEAPDGPAFRHAVAMLPLVRRLDTTRMVLLNSGRYDNVGRSAIGDVPGLKLWPRDPPSEPWVGVNATRETVRTLGITWPPGWLALHPGAGGEYSVVRWTASSAGTIRVEAAFTGIAERATTDVHVLHNGRPLFDGGLNMGRESNQSSFVGRVVVAAGDTIDGVVGYGNGNYGADSTALALKIRTPDARLHDAAAEFSDAANPNDSWSYGRLKPSARPESTTFARYPVRPAEGLIGSLCNPGSTAWEDTISDRHVYPRVPHTAEIVNALRTLSAGDQPVFLSEYGIGSAVDLWRAVRHFEQRGAVDLEDAQFFRAKLAAFLTDYERWQLQDTFPRPEDFFAESLRKMAAQRSLGLNAIRSNPHIVGHSLTGAIDHVMCGEGLTTLFRELKPGTIDALYDAWYPLRWCLFAEPAHVYRGRKVHLEAVLANEDELAPGEYPARVQVVGPDAKMVYDRSFKVVVPARSGGAEPPLAAKWLDSDLTLDGPEGKYSLVATFTQGAAAAGRPAEFYVTDPARMPAVEAEVVLWSDDPPLSRWLSDHGIRTRPFDPRTSMTRREVILVAAPSTAGKRAACFRELALRIVRGSCVIFLTPEVFKDSDRPTSWLPLGTKGNLAPINGWLYLKDEWAKRHPIFEGLPAGGLMDYGYYREIIPDLLFSGQEPPAQAVAGAIKASQDYASGLMVAVYKQGAGRFVLNTLRIRENLGNHPAAERLLRNLLCYAGQHTQEAPVAAPAEFAGTLHAIEFDRP